MNCFTYKRKSFFERFLETSEEEHCDATISSVVHQQTKRTPETFRLQNELIRE